MHASFDFYSKNQIVKIFLDFYTFTALWSETVCIISVLCNLWRFSLWFNILPLFIKVPRAGAFVIVGVWSSSYISKI